MPDSQWQAKLSDNTCDSLAIPVSDNEIKAALWSMKAHKAPGPDGLHAGFFQRFWIIVGSSVTKEVKEIFEGKVMPKYLNKTNIALIPKIQSPETLSNYRLISLCNSVYKIVTKIIVSRLRHFLSGLISPFQSAFIPGRKGIGKPLSLKNLYIPSVEPKVRKDTWLLRLIWKKPMTSLNGVSLGRCSSVLTSLGT